MFFSFKLYICQSLNCLYCFAAKNNNNNINTSLETIDLMETILGTFPAE